MSRDAAGEDGEEPHPAPAGVVDIRVPVPDVDGVLPRDRDRSKNGVEGFWVGLGVAALPHADRRTPPRIYTGNTEPMSEHRAIICGAQRHRDLLATESMDGLKAPLHWGIGGGARWCGSLRRMGDGRFA